MLREGRCAAALYTFDDSSASRQFPKAALSETRLLHSCPMTAPQGYTRYKNIRCQEAMRTLPRDKGRPDGVKKLVVTTMSEEQGMIEELLPW